MDAPLIRPSGDALQHPGRFQRPRTLLLHNPRAGDGTTDAETLIAALTRSGCEVTCVIKQDEAHAEALAASWDLVAVAGGDGTVAKAARKLKDRTTPLAILPMGTANNVARSLGLTAPPHELAARLAGADMRALDVGLAKGPWGKRGFVEAVGFGAVAGAIATAGPKPAFEHRIRLGREGLRRTIAEAKPYIFRMRIDGQKLKGAFLFVEVLNLCFSGPRLPFAHRAEAGDGILDVLFLTEEDRQPVLDWIAESPELEPPPLKLVQARTVEVEWTDAPLRIDDRVYERAKKKAPATVTIGINGESFGVLCPDLSAPAAMAPRRD